MAALEYQGLTFTQCYFCDKPHSYRKTSDIPPIEIAMNELVCERKECIDRFNRTWYEIMDRLKSGQ